MSRFDPFDAYSRGLAGAVKNPRADEEFDDAVLRIGGNPYGAEVAHEWEFAGLGEGKLTLLFPTVLEVFPDSLPGPAQVRGDCVSRGVAGALLDSMALEIADGKPDEETGLLEGAPEIPTLGVMNGVVSSESLWWHRGYNGDGWTCSSAAQVAIQTGFLVRKEYPDLGIDLTKYTMETTSLWGARKPPEKVLNETKQHHARNATNLKGREQVRDFIAAGYGVFNCSGLGFSKERNEDGFSRQVGSWAHSQRYIGYDDRSDTKKKYGEALVLWINSWGRWNSGPRAIRGTNIEIPHGAFWALASTIDKCSNIALSSVAGWPRRKHTTFGATGNL